MSSVEHLDDVIARLERAAEQLRSGELSPDAAATMVEDCAALATQAAAELEQLTREESSAPAPGQDGAALRLVLPWKYGFKSGKALVKVSFTDKRPVNFWQALQPSEYGFWANVNPDVAHPRWSQARERLLGSNEMVPTQIYNGYGSFVSSMYEGLKNEKLFM